MKLGTYEVVLENSRTIPAENARSIEGHFSQACWVSMPNGIELLSSFNLHRQFCDHVSDCYIANKFVKCAFHQILFETSGSLLPRFGFWRTFLKSNTGFWIAGERFSATKIKPGAGSMEFDKSKPIFFFSKSSSPKVNSTFLLRCFEALERRGAKLRHLT